LQIPKRFVDSLFFKKEKKPDTFGLYFVCTVAGKSQYMLPKPPPNPESPRFELVLLQGHSAIELDKAVRAARDSIRREAGDLIVERQKVDTFLDELEEFAESLKKVRFAERSLRHPKIRGSLRHCLRAPAVAFFPLL
jgi:hypothetical protein